MEKRILNLEECCKVLHMTEEEILYLVRTKAIPHGVADDGSLRFTEWEILARIIPAPPKGAMAAPKIDIKDLTKDQIMEVFSSMLQRKAAEEAKALKTEPHDLPVTQAEAPAPQGPRTTKKDMEIPEPEGETGEDEEPKEEKEEVSAAEEDPEKKEEPKKETAKKPKK